MTVAPDAARLRSDVIAIVRSLPPGRVTTCEAIGRCVRAAPRHVAHVLATLKIDERDMLPWHRVVAKGGAIGRGPDRDAHFARLVREGIMVSPAGVVQNLADVAIESFPSTPPSGGTLDAPPAPPAARRRSIGYKDRPR